MWMWTHVIISVVCGNVSYIALHNPLSGGYDDVSIPYRLETIPLMIEPTSSEIIPLERLITCRCVHTSLGVNSATMKLKLEAII